MAYSFKTDLKWSDVTPHKTFVNRRQLIAGAGAAFGSIAAPALAVSDAVKSRHSTDMESTGFEDITTYNNFYEFGTGKSDPATYADALTTDPWNIKIDGLVDKPGDYDLADILSAANLEERIYRHRCVETWAMIVPWIGFELGSLLERVGVQSGAKYVAFETLHRPSEMRGQKRLLLEWPYVEGLRLDEAMNPLTILATGLYGEEMPKQNGAPIRLVVPWKYGYKSIKSVVRITLTDKQPKTTWNEIGPDEYGFYSNVNPEVSHPRWSQATERPVGGGLFARRKPTLKFNSYEAEVASLYAGMDLVKNH